jgi:Tissue inhibitor of metalloproteinase
MKHKLYLFIFGFVLTFSLGSFEQIFACECFQQQSVCDAYGNAKAIFVGEVIEGKSAETLSDRLKTNSNDQSFVFKVSQNFLGTEEEKNVTIHTGFGGGDCGFPFQKGEKYLVYAYESEGNLHTNICTRTRRVSTVEEDFEDLKYLLLTSGAKIYGTVNLYAKLYPYEEISQPMAKLKLRVEQTDGEKKNFEVTTDDQGKYQLTGLPAGKYKVIPLLMNGLMVEDSQISELLLNDKGCAKNDLYAKNDSRISGKIIDPQGKPVEGIDVDLIPSAITSRIPENENLEGQTYALKGGVFTFYNIPPGKYRLAANYSSVPSEETPFPTTYYKLKGEKTAGTIIEVGLGQKIEGFLIQLPPPLPMKEIRGKVYWKDGKPAEGIMVNLRDVEAKQNISGFDTDANGNFTLKGFAGRKYILETFIEKIVDNKLVQFGAKDVVFTLNEKTGEFKLVLEKKIED